MKQANISLYPLDLICETPQNKNIAINSFDRAPSSRHDTKCHGHRRRYPYLQARLPGLAVNTTIHVGV